MCSQGQAKRISGHHFKYRFEGKPVEHHVHSRSVHPMHEASPCLVAWEFMAAPKRATGATLASMSKLVGHGRVSFVPQKWTSTSKICTGLCGHGN